MFMKRMFLPVGQGAFYCERFSKSGAPKWDKNFVYDCGVLLKDKGSSRDKLQWLENVIDGVFAQDEAIAAIFISHLHEDHLSGLKHLAKRCKIKKIYLPLMDNESRQLMLLDYVTRSLKSTNNTSDGSKDLVGQILGSENLALDLPKFLKSDIEVVPVAASGPSDAIEAAIEAFPLGEDEALLPSSSWKYKLFCIKEGDAAYRVKKALLKVVNGVLKKNEAEVTAESIAELINISRDSEDARRDNVVNEICNIYKEHMGGHHFNDYSLVVYSGCDNPKGLRTARECCPQFSTGGQFHCFGSMWGLYYCPLFLEKPSYHYPRRADAVGCLYTGDFNAMKYWDALKNYFMNEWATIGCFQIPHHGSNKSYNIEFLNEKTCHVISTGLGNKYGHPSLSVLDNYLAKKDFPIVVTQDPRSCVCFNIGYRNSIKGANPTGEA